MKKEYISPEIEIQKFSFEDILNGVDPGETDDPLVKHSTNEDFGYASGSEEELGQLIIILVRQSFDCLTLKGDFMIKTIAKKLNVFVLVIALLSAITVQFSAASYLVSEDGFYYLIENSEAVIYGYDFENRQSDIVIPNKISDYPVTKIAPRAFSNKSELTSVSFSQALSLKSIGKYAFYACTSLEKLLIPGTLNTFGEFAFQDCTALKSVDIYSDVSVIPEQAFGNCTSLEKINIPSTVKSIGRYAFYNCLSLNELTLSKNITEISNGAFYNCDNLTLYGYYDSIAESYAETNNIPFIHLDKKITLGDVNSDGTVDVNDVTLVQLYLAGVSDIVLNEDALVAANFNQDGQIDVIDVTAIQYFIASR